MRAAALALVLLAVCAAAQARGDEAEPAPARFRCRLSARYLDPPATPRRFAQPDIAVDAHLAGRIQLSRGYSIQVYPEHPRPGRFTLGVYPNSKGVGVEAHFAYTAPTLKLVSFLNKPPGLEDNGIFTRLTCRAADGEPGTELP